MMNYKIMHLSKKIIKDGTTIALTNYQRLGKKGLEVQIHTDVSRKKKQLNISHIYFTGIYHKKWLYNEYLIVSN